MFGKNHMPSELVCIGTESACWVTIFKKMVLGNMKKTQQHEMRTQQIQLGRTMILTLEKTQF